MLLSCSAASVSLTYFPLIVPSLRVLAQRLAATQTDSTLLMRRRGWRWSPFPFCPLSQSAGGETSRGACLHMASRSASAGSFTYSTHMCSVAARSSHFPPLFSCLQDVERLQTGEGGGWKGSRVWLKQDICYIIKAGPSAADLKKQLDIFCSKKFKIWGFFFLCRQGAESKVIRRSSSNLISTDSAWCQLT